ncbi:MAG: hypothetical protein V8R07_04885 [Bacteroides fragilis]
MAFDPHIWVDGDRIDWYAYHPTQEDYRQLRQMASDYVETFRIQVPAKGHGPKLVYICAPLRGEVDKNIEFARQKAQEVFQAGDIPVCPHLMFPPIADPGDPAQDLAAREMGLRLVEKCQQVNVYGPVTEGMWRSIHRANKLDIPVVTDSGPEGAHRAQKKEKRQARGGQMIQEKTTEDLRHMTDEEGLILQGCGGDLQEWVDGINDRLTQEGILLNGTKFEHAATFQHDGLTNLLFSFEGVQFNVGNLAMWRIQTHSQFGGTWLSDYVPNRLGGFIQEQKPVKPKMELLGRDGNIFSIMGTASQLLQMAGMHDQNKEMIDRVTSCRDYDQALHIISEYVETELSAEQAPKKSNKKKGRNSHER